MSLRDFQTRLASYGLDPGPLDGVWGPRTEGAASAALDKAFGAVGGLPTLLPPEWMPPAIMQRVIVHWTAGGRYASALDRQHYHLLVEGNRQVVRGDPSIELNQAPIRAGYAAHTLNGNTGSIGIALCGMHDAQERPWSPGPCPFSREQWEAMGEAVADLCRRYAIPVTPQTVLSHAEVEGTLGIKQRGKWDIARLPFDPAFDTATKVGDRLRAEVAELL